MKTLKKTLCLILAVVMVVGVLILPAHAADDYTAAVADLQKYGVIQGKGDGLPHADDPVTRADMAAIVYRIMTGDTQNPTEANATAATKYGSYAAKYPDAKEASWAIGYIGFCSNQGVLKGDEMGNVKPNQQITGYEVQAMLLRALGYDKNNEYTGKDWKFNILADATKTGISKNVNIDPAGKTLRGAVAQLTLNAATKTSRVAPAIVPNIGYNSLNEKLIEVGTATTATDAWGAVTTTTPFTFTWPGTDVEKSYDTPATILATYNAPVTECDVATALGITTGGKTLTTYTNGVGNKGSVDIDAGETNQTIGAQGRQTIVYADRIIYKDTVLAKVTDVTPAVVDTAGHVIKAAVTTFTLYVNNVFQGNDGANFATAPNKVTSTAFKAAGTFTKGQIITANILTNTTSNAIGTGTAAATTNLVNAKVATPTQVTVSAIIRDNKLNKAIGFKGTDGVSYMYDVTFGYNNGSSVVVLDSTSINKTYNVYTDGNNNVLGLAPVTAAGDTGYGVITAAKTVVVSSDKGVDKYGLELTILKSDNTTKTIKWIGNDVVPTAAYSTGVAAYDSLKNASTGYVERQLVKYVLNTNNSNFYNVTVGTTGLKSDAILAGDADTLSTTGLLTNKTVIFVQKYKMDTTVDATGNTYVTNGYDIYTGFETIPDLTRASGTKIAENGVVLSNPSNQMRYYYFASGGYADCALVIWADQQSTDKVENVPNYAYIDTDRQQANVHEGYYEFNTLKNGVASTLKVSGSSFAAVQTNGTGLYMYTTTTNGENEITGYVNKIAKGTDKWKYKDGVLSVADGVSVNGGTAVNYLAVTPNATIYLVNNTTGRVYTGYTLDNIQSVYGAANVDLYFQTNAYGFVDTVYAVEPDVDLFTPDAPKTTADITYVVNIYAIGTGTITKTITVTQEDVPAGSAYYTTASNILTLVGIDPSRVYAYGPWPENGTVVGGKDVTVTFNVYYF